jgi:hypothetical protein
MAQQTAVEWLQSLHKKGILIEKSFEMAKEMEKQQIMDAYWNGTTDTEKQDALIDAEKFYNEYYGKKK